MESAVERDFRKTFPQMGPRLAVLVLIAYGVDYCHAAFRSQIVRHFPSRDLADLYIRATSTVILSAIFSGLGLLVLSYYYSLRNRRIYSALTETGLAVRAVFAGLLALALFMLAIHINAGGLAGN